jgi:hypothetical protein
MKSSTSTDSTTTAVLIHDDYSASTTTLSKATAPASASGGMCDRIHPDELPSECTCSDDTTPLGLIVSCLKHFNSTHFNDTIGIQLTIDPCNAQGASISLDLTEETHGIDFPITGLRAGEEHYYPIPGLSIIVPMIGSVGVDVDVWIAGNVDQLFLQVGLNACTLVRDKFLCASSFPGINHILPWWVLRGNYTFGDLCNSTITTPTTTTTTTTTATITDGSVENVLATE